MNLQEAYLIATRVKAELAPHCEEIEIAGSIRRQVPEVSDIEICCIPKPYSVGLWADGIAAVLDKWPKVRGYLPCKAVQRMLPEGILLDLYTARPENWGLILAVRTGSADYSHQVLANRWLRRGYKSVNGMLTLNGREIPVYTEQKLFDLIGLPYVRPERRFI